MNSTGNSSSILKEGKLKPGIYKIQNIQSQTYLDVEVHSRGVCCRPAKDLEEGRGLWEIKSFAAGYTVQMVEPGKPDQFCIPTVEHDKDYQLFVAAYPVAWRVEVVYDQIYRGFEFIRFYWEAMNFAWYLNGGSSANGTKVSTWVDDGPAPRRIWKLIPVKVEGGFTPFQPSSETPGSGSLPSYDEDTTGPSSTRTRHAESERDDFGTIVTETTTITTRRRYRVEDA